MGRWWNVQRREEDGTDDIHIDEKVRSILYFRLSRVSFNNTIMSEAAMI